VEDKRRNREITGKNRSEKTLVGGLARERDRQEILYFRKQLRGLLKMTGAVLSPEVGDDVVRH
jgi:hypothetical protein